MAGRHASTRPQAPDNGFVNIIQWIIENNSNLPLPSLISIPHEDNISHLSAEYYRKTKAFNLAASAPISSLDCFKTACRETVVGSGVVNKTTYR